MNENTLLVTIRHGDYNGGEEGSLSEVGHQQMCSIRDVIDTFVVETLGEGKVTRIYFSFSALPRAIQSTRRLAYRGEDMIVSNLYLTGRDEIRNPQKILEKVMGIAEHYTASVIVIVAHGDMPVVIAETARNLVTGEKKYLDSVEKGCGFITNMTTGQVTPISYDLRKKASPIPKVQLELKNQFDDDIPF